MFKRVWMVMAAVLVFGVAGTASAQGVGIRAGVSGDPDQFYFGGHVETAPLVEQLTFRPNVEIGVGDRVTLMALNLELVYSIPLQDEPWRIYFGGGPAANIYSFRQSRGGGSDVGGGFNVLLGIQHRGGLFTELKVGAIDSPNIKFAIGYVIR